MTLTNDFPYYDGIAPTIDPANTNRVFLTTEAQGIYESLDAGNSWARVTGVPFSSPQRVTFDSAHSTLYLGTNGGGVFKLIEPTTTVTPTYTQTLTSSMTYTCTQTPTLTQTQTCSVTSTVTLTSSQTLTPSQTLTSSMTPTVTSTSTTTATTTQTGTVTLTLTLTPTPSGILQILRHCPYPDPVKLSKNIFLYVEMTDVPDTLSVKIYTISVRQVQHCILTDLSGSPNLQIVYEGNVARFAYTIPLTLKDGQGNDLANGVYYYWLEAKKAGVDYKVIGKFVVLH